MQFPRLSINKETYRWWVLGVTVIGGFMSILDANIVNIALPKMMAVFSVDTDKAEWILTAYLLTMGVVQPTTGYCCDRFGTRRMYLLSLAVFVIGSALCGIAWNNESMIAFRVIQAIGGGLITPVTMSLIFQIFPIQERYMAMGIWGISAMVAPAVGPALSGYLVEYWDWRLIFMINIPIGVIGYILAILIMKETTVHRGQVFDFLGCSTSGVGLFCLLLALSKGASEGWTSAYIVILLYISITSLILFVVIELNHINPIVDLRLFNDWNFTVSNAVVFIGTISLYGGVFLVPLFMENLRGYTAMQTGALTFPAAVCSGLMMPVSAKLVNKFGAKIIVIIGLCILTLGTFALIYMDMDTSYEYIVWIMVVRGFGLGLFMMPISVLGMDNVPIDKISRASSISNAIRQISGSLGIAILATVIQQRRDFHVEHIAENINNNSIAAKNMIGYIQDLLMRNKGESAWFAYNKTLAYISGIAQKQASIFAFDDAFFVLGVICVVGTLVTLLVRPMKKHTDEVTVIME